MLANPRADATLCAWVPWVDCGARICYMIVSTITVYWVILWDLIFANFVICVKFIKNLYGLHLILDQFMNILPCENYPIYRPVLAELEISWNLWSVRAYRHVPLAEKKCPTVILRFNFWARKFYLGQGPVQPGYGTTFMCVAKQGVALKVGFG